MQSNSIVVVEGPVTDAAGWALVHSQAYVTERILRARSPYGALVEATGHPDPYHPCIIVKTVIRTDDGTPVGHPQTQPLGTLLSFIYEEKR